MASCRIIESPVTKEQVRSELWNSLLNRVKDVTKADEIYAKTQSDEFISRFGDWRNSTYSLTTNKIGEPTLLSVVSEFLNINEAKNDSTLESKVKEFINNVGFTLSYDELNDVLGSPVAIVDFFNKTIRINEGKADATTLAEEAMHIYIKVLEKENPILYNSLMYDAINKPEYKQVYDEYVALYEGDTQKIAEETVAKILTQRLIQKESFGEVQNNRIDSWFNKVIKFVKDLIGVSSEQLNDVFDIVIDEFEDNYNKVYDLAKSDTRMYQADKGVNAKQKYIVDKINSENLTLTADNKKYIDNRTGEQLPRVHELVEASKPKGLELSDELKKKAEDASKAGTLGHSDITNIIERIMQRIQGIPESNRTPKSNNLSKEMYLQLETYFDKWVADKLKIDPKGVFILEKTIRDAKYAGTPDLLFIQSDGVTHIHDWKFVGYATTEKGEVLEDVVKQGRRNEWYVQMQKYKEMLSKRYGITKFAETRFKPIASVYEKDSNGDYKLVKIEIGDDKAYLKDIPLEDEKTGNKNLDNLIKFSIAKRESLIKNRSYPTKQEYDAARSEANTITNYILKLQRDKDVNDLLNYLEGKIESFNKMIVSDDFSDEFANIIDFVNFYKTVEDYYINDITNKGSDEYSRFVDLSSNIRTLNVAYYNKLSEFKEDANISDINHTVGWLEGKTVMLHQFKNDVFRYFNNLKESAFNMIDKNINTFNQDIKELSEKAKQEGNTYKDILQETKNGYSLISQFKKEFFDALPIADVKWLKSNIEIPKTITVDGKEVDTKTQFEKDLAEFKESNYIKLLSEDGAANAIRNYNYKYNVFNDDFKTEAFKYYQTKGYHKYLKPKDIWKNDKYIWLETNKDKAISKLYYKFIDINKRADLISDKHIRSNFLPMIEKNTIESLRTNGISFKSLSRSFFEDLKYISDDEKALRLKYTHQIAKEDISLDLGTVFSKFAYNVFYNEQFTKLENKGKILQNILQTGEYYKLDGGGNVVTDNGSPVTVTYNTGSNTDVSDIKNTVGTFTDFLDYYLKGVDNKSKDISVKLFGIDYSLNRAVAKLQSYYSATALTLSPISAAVNLTGGLANLHIIGAKGKFFTNQQALIGSADITRLDSKALQLTKFFDVTSVNGVYTKANELTQEAIKLDSEWKYILQRKGEGFVQNTTLLAYLQNIDIEGNEIKKSEKGKSLYTTLVKADGTIDTKLLNEEQYENIRSKVRALNNEIMGSLTERDFVTAQQYIGGRLLLHFRKWALPMTKARLGSLNYNSNLEEYEEGRYRQALKLFITGHAIPETLGILKDAITLNFKGERKGMQVLLERAKAKNPDLDMEIEEYTELFMRNLRATMGEMGIILALLALALGIAPDDDDEEDSNFNAVTSKIIFRTSQELLFWTDYDSAKRIINAPIPMLGLLDRTGRIFTELNKSIRGEDNDLAYRLAKLTPLNPILSIEQQIESVNK